MHQAQRRRLRPKRIHLRLFHHKAEVAERRQGAYLAVRNHDLPRADAGGGFADHHRLFRVRREAYRHHDVARLNAADLLAQHPAHAVEQDRTALQMAQSIGEVRGDAKGSTQSGDVDGVGVGQQLYRALQHLRLGAGGQLLQRLRVRAGKLLQDIERRFRHGLALHLAEQPGAVAVAGGLLHQVHAKQLFHFVEAGEVKGVGKADQRRGRHVGALGNDGNRIKRHAVGIVQHVAGDLLQPLAQAIVAIADLLLQFVQAGCCRHVIPQIQSYDSKRKTASFKCRPSIWQQK